MTLTLEVLNKSLTNGYQKIIKYHVWPCAFPQCSQWRDSKEGIQWHEHTEHGAESPKKNKILDYEEKER